MNWETKDRRLFKRFEFTNFAEALSFVDRVGMLAEQVNHHPDILFGWGYAEISLFTHSEDGITDKDRSLARSIDQIQE